MITALQALANLEAVLDDGSLNKISAEIISNWVKTIAAALDEQAALLKADTSFNDLPKELVKDNGIEYIRIPYIAFARWDVRRRAAIAKASV